MIWAALKAFTQLVGLSAALFLMFFVLCSISLLAVKPTVYAYLSESVARKTLFFIRALLWMLVSAAPCGLMCWYMYRNEWGFDFGDAVLAAIISVLVTLMGALHVCEKAELLANGILDSEPILHEWLEENRAWRINSVVSRVAVFSGLKVIVAVSAAQLVIFVFGAVPGMDLPLKGFGKILAAVSLCYLMVHLLIHAVMSANPSSLLLVHCSASFSRGRHKRENFILRKRRKGLAPISANRWRSVEHRGDFLASAYLIRVIRGMKRKMPSVEYAYLDQVYRKVAYLLRGHSFLVEQGANGISRKQLCGSVIALLVNTNPVATAEKIDSLTGSETGHIEHPGSRVSRMLESVDSVVQRHSRSLTIILAVSLAVVLIVTGRVDVFIDLIWQVIFSGQGGDALNV